MLNCLMMLALKYVSREEIQDVTKDIFDRYKDYILGDYVWGLSSTDLNGQQIQTPPWSLVLSYEHAVRKRAYSLMLTERLMLGAALEKAWKCPTTKERHFITPLALYSKRAYPQNNNQNAGNWNPKGKGKGNRSPKDFRKGLDKDRMVKRFATGSMLESATIRSASLLTCAISVSRRVILRSTAKKRSRPTRRAPDSWMRGCRKFHRIQTLARYYTCFQDAPVRGLLVSGQGSLPLSGI